MKLRLFSCTLLSLLFASELIAQCPTGTIRNDATGSTSDIKLCTRDGQADEITFRTDYQVTTSVATILTDNSGEILLAVPGQTVDFEGFPDGKCRAFILTYTGSLTATVGENMYSIDLATGCFARSRNFIEVEHQAPIAGLITDQEGMALASLCVEDNTPDYVGFDVTGEDAERYVFLITDTDGNVEKVDFNGFEDFGSLGPGTSYVYGLAYSGDLQIRRGENIFTDQLVDGCYDLTDNFITIVRNEVDGGRLSVDGEKHIDVDSTTSQAPLVDRVTFSTSPFIYVIIDESRIIRGFSQGPAVDLSFLPQGKFFIYAYGYTGTINAEVGQRIWDSGIRFASGCFLMSDAVVVTKKTPADPTRSCTADAGTISATASPVTLQNGIARVEAIQGGNAIVPIGYDSVYFLTVGPTETIIALSVASPNFSVNSSDTFSIFYLNAEVTDSGSAEYIDLGAIQFGVTTMGLLASSILDSGVCADLTTPGAEVIVLPDPAAPCTAFASSSTPVAATVALVNGEAILAAMADGGAAFPANAELTYILSQGFDQTIVALSDSASFTVTETGAFAIHALVAETSDTTSLDYLDRSAWVSNGLNIFDAFDAIFAEGICADIDLFGAEFQVTAGSSCAAFAGTVTAAADTIFLVNQRARISAIADGNAVVPGGFDRTYVLSFGPNKIIQAISALPRFDVMDTGDYYIHSWVGEFTDPLSVDYVNLPAIQQGISLISDIELQIQGSGICSDIDEAGTPVYVDQIVPTFALTLRTISTGNYLRVGGVFASHPQNGQLLLTDALGRIVIRHSVVLSEHPQTFELNRSAVGKGVYYLTLLGDVDGILSTQGVLLD